jgi:hypothetical protein
MKMAQNKFKRFCIGTFGNLVLLGICAVFGIFIAIPALSQITGVALPVTINPTVLSPIYTNPIYLGIIMIVCMYTLMKLGTLRAIEDVEAIEKRIIKQVDERKDLLVDAVTIINNVIDSQEKESIEQFLARITKKEGIDINGNTRNANVQEVGINTENS